MISVTFRAGGTGQGTGLGRKFSIRDWGLRERTEGVHYSQA